MDAYDGKCDVIARIFSTYEREWANHLLVATIIAAVIATYSGGNGLLAWPILIGSGILLSIRRGQIITLACAGAVAAGIYFIGYQFTGTLSIMNLIRHPVYLLKFVGSYMAMPFSALAPYWFGTALGIMSMCTVAGVAVVGARAGLGGSRTVIVLFGSYFYTVLTGVLIAAGRMDPAQVGIGNAKYARYMTEPLIAWAALVLLCVWLCSRLAPRKAVAYGTVVVCAALALVGFSTLGGWLRDRDAEFANVQLGALAVQNDIFDRDVVLNLFSWKPDNVEIWSQGLRDSGVSVFYKGYRRWLGHPVSSFGGVGGSVPGEIAHAAPVTGGVEVVGWVEWSGLRRSSGWLLLVSDTGPIVGLGRRLPAGFPPALRNLRTPESLGWVGFVNSKYAVKSIRAYVIVKEGLVPVEGWVSASIYHTSG